MFISSLKFKLNIKNSNIFQGDKRTVKAKKNIVASVLIKGIDSLIYLLLVPVTLGYLNPYEYGIWLTLNSILMWINSFDIGLGNGLRNKLAEAMANNNVGLGRSYVSTAFIMLFLIMGSVIFVGTLFYPLINWYDILNASPKQVPHLSQIVYFAFVIFCLNFIFKIVGNIYLAMQLPAVNNLMIMSGHLLSLVIIYLLTITTSGSLMYVAMVYSISPLFVYLIAYPITFKKVYSFLAPSYSFFNKRYLKDLFNIGIQFFFLQLSGILLFAFSNLLISHMFGPENVTPYNIAYRYFSIVPMATNLFLAPMWSATTDAYTKGDIKWIKKSMKAIRKILIIATIGLCIMIFISNYVYNIWVGNEIHISLLLSGLMGVYVCILIWSLSYSNFLNGLGKLRLQTINTVIVAISFLPICLALGKNMDILGVIVGMCILNLSGLILNKIQLEKIISGKAQGIWIK